MTKGVLHDCSSQGSFGVAARWPLVRSRVAAWAARVGYRLRLAADRVSSGVVVRVAVRRRSVVTRLPLNCAVCLSNPAGAFFIPVLFFAERHIGRE
jgi:hypothetical protein